MDKITARFLEKQAEEGAHLASESDILHLEALVRGQGPAQHFLAHFSCDTYVVLPDRRVERATGCVVGIYLPDDYLRQASTYEVLTWLHPTTVFHPNIRPPHMCVGERFLRPGTPLVELLYQIHAVITYRKWASAHGLNPDACQWAINNQPLFPSDSRPLKRRVLPINIEVASAEGKPA